MKKLLLLIGVTFLISSCAKDGDPGAQGPAGNANIKSFNYTVTPGQWQVTGSVGVDYEKYVDLTYSEITQDIVDNGAVLIYWQNSGSSIQLPVSLPANNSTFNLLGSSSLGSVSLEYFFSDFASFSINQNFDFKILVIDGTLRITNPQINWNDPKSVAQGLDLNL